MKTLTIELPDDVDEHEVCMQIAGRLYEKGLLTAGPAGRIVGLSRVEFWQTIGQYGFSAFNSSVEDLQHDIKVVLGDQSMKSHLGDRD